MDAVPLRHLADGDRIPPCRLDQDVSGFVRDHRVEPAHDPGQTYGLACIGNDQIFTGKLAFDTGESLQRLTVASTANDDAAAFEQILIKDVRGFPDLP